MSIFDLSSEGADRLLGISNTMLVIGLIVALAATIGTIWASSVIGKYSNIRQAGTEVAVANASAASKAADARAAEATLAAAQANLRSASLEKDTAELRRQAEEAKAEAARVNERLHKMQEIRRLPVDKAASLSELLKSEVFQKEPKPKIRVMSVADPEASIYAMDFLNLFKLHGVWEQNDIDGDAPGLAIQYLPEKHNFGLKVRSFDPTEKDIAFILLNNHMNNLGLNMSVSEDPTLPVNTACLAILRKPLAG